MAFHLLRVGSRVSIAAAERNSIAATIGVCSSDFSVKRSAPTPIANTPQCTGDSCPLDMTRLSSNRRSSLSSSPSNFSPTGVSPPNYTIIKRHYSKRAEPERERKQKDDSDSDSDSDSDTECKGMERSEFWRRKMRTFHGILDINKDSVISFDDFQLLAKRFQDLGHLDEQQAAEFNSVVRMTWEEQWGEISPYNLITVEQYLTDMSHVLSDKQLKRRVHNFLPYLFKAVDKDRSGFISVNEFKLFFKCLGLSDETAAISFALIDKNGDGKLSIKEFVKLGKDFFFTEDETRVSKMFWGPLVDH